MNFLMQTIKEVKMANDKILYKLVCGDKFDKVSYGIEVYYGNDGKIEKKSVPNITTDFNQINEIYNIVIENCVLPSTLEEVIGEYISIKYTV